jgi:glycogen debranching enzyme
VTESWAFSGEPPVLGGADGAQTLVEGSLFCVSTSNGDIPAAGSYGLFFRDLRCLARWELRVDGHSPQPLASYRHEPSAATFVARVPPRRGLADSHLLVLRERHLGDGMREDVVVRNLGQETAGCSVTLLIEADFADLFEVKENRVVAHPDRVTALAATDATGLHFGYRWMGHSRDVHVTTDGQPLQAPGLLTFSVAIPPRQEWRTSLRVRFAVDGVPVEPSYPGDGHPDEATTVHRHRQRSSRGPVVTTPHAALDAALRTGDGDLGALRIKDPDHPGREVVAAGAPWFMTVFGRDSLLTAWMALPVDPDLALGTLETLARYQGRTTAPLTEEQPGRILHEMRFGAQAGLALGGGSVYYGTADATSLFVMLLGEAHNWGLAQEHVSALLPHADAALTWMLEHGDRDGDGFLEYQRATDQGLVNQGWKDSFDGINFASGALAAPPLALCEVQGYAYGAYVARSALARDAGDEALADDWAARAAALKQAFNEVFWLPDKGWFAVALDRDKRPVDALTSNIGHCLWTGIVDDDKAAVVVKHLMSDQMFTGWGVRTLGSAMGAFNPLSYHNGSVWPHDNAILVAGLDRYGFLEEAQRLSLALLEAGTTFGSRFPELWSGFDSTEFPAPLPYPTSCSPQAWAAAAPFLLLRSLLGLHPRLPAQQVTLDPHLPPSMLPLRIDNLRLGDARVRIDVDSDGWTIQGLPSTVQVSGSGQDLRH